MSNLSQKCKIFTTRYNFVKSLRGEVSCLATAVETETGAVQTSVPFRHFPPHHINPTIPHSVTTGTLEVPNARGLTICPKFSRIFPAQMLHPLVETKGLNRGTPAILLLHRHGRRHAASLPTKHPPSLCPSLSPSLLLLLPPKPACPRSWPPPPSDVHTFSLGGAEGFTATPAPSRPPSLPTPPSTSKGWSKSNIAEPPSILAPPAVPPLPSRPPPIPMSSSSANFRNGLRAKAPARAARTAHTVAATTKSKE